MAINISHVPSTDCVLEHCECASPKNKWAKALPTLVRQTLDQVALKLRLHPIPALCYTLFVLARSLGLLCKVRSCLWLMAQNGIKVNKIGANAVKY